MLDVVATHRLGAFTLDARLQVPAGVTALVGPSGAGKSTLLRLVAGLDVPDSGRITLNEEVLSEQPRGRFVRAHRRRIGMVFQGPRLMPHLSVEGNIRLGARGQALDMALIEQLGLTALLGRAIGGLSGGEGQRVMLARALAGAPRLLLLDEPLTGLDPASREALMGVFANVFAALSIPVIYVTHQLDEAARLASRFALMRDGVIVAAGPAASVLPHYGTGPGFEAGQTSALRGITQSVAPDGLARIAIGNQSIEVPGLGLRAGLETGLRLHARDLILARSRPTEISARNALTGQIEQINSRANGQAEVVLRIEGQAVSALVMARTVSEMRLAAGQPIFVLFKSAGVEPIV